MLQEQEKQELRAYQAKLVMLDENKVKGHLSSQERDKITILLTENHSIRQIAKILGRSPGTISGELRRDNAVYYRGKYIGNTYQCKIRLVKITQWNKIKQFGNKKTGDNCLKTRFISTADSRTIKREIWYKNSS